MPVASCITSSVFLVYNCATAHKTDLIMSPIVGEEKEVQMTAGMWVFKKNAPFACVFTY